MDGNVGARIAAGDPLGKLRARDLLGLQQGAIAAIDMAQDAIRDEGAQLLVIGIEQLVIDDLGEYTVLLGQLRQGVQLREVQYRRLFDEQMLACFQNGPRGLKMTVVRRGHTHGVDPAAQQLLHTARLGSDGKRPQAIGW